MIFFALSVRQRAYNGMTQVYRKENRELQDMISRKDAEKD